MAIPDRLSLLGLNWRGLTAQMFALVVLPITLLVLAVAVVGLSLHRDAMRTLVGERDERAARAAAGTLTEQLNHRSAAVRSLALQAQSSSSDEDLNAVLRDSAFLLPNFDRGLAYFRSDGTLLASRGDPAWWQFLTTEADSELKAILTPGESPAFQYLQDPQQREIVLLVAAASKDGGLWAIGAFSPTLLAQKALTSAFPVNEQLASVLIAPGPQVLYQRPSSAFPAPVEAHPGVREALRGESGTTYLSVEGREHVVAFTPVSPLGWALVIEEPWDAVASPLLRTTEVAPLVMVPLLVLAMVALWFGARRIIQPLQTLESRADALAWGDYEAIHSPVGGIEEIRRLQQTLIYLAERVKIAQQSLRSYIGAITTGQEEERRRLARELHDDTLQSLIALNQRVQLAQLSLDNNPERTSLDEIRLMIDQTIQDLRRITRALRPLYLEDLGLVAALDMLARETSQVSQVKVRFQHLGTEQRLSPTEELTLYRMAQEGLSNVVRHARAEHTTLSLRFSPAEITLELVDDGQGFEVPESPAEFAPRGHFGLLGLYERAELIGAQLQLVSKPGQGTRLTVSLPLTQA